MKKLWLVFCFILILPFFACEDNVRFKFTVLKMSYIDAGTEYFYTTDEILNLAVNNELSETATIKQYMENYFAANKSFASVNIYFYKDNTAKFVYSEEYYDMFSWEQEGQCFKLKNGDFSITIVGAESVYYMEDTYRDCVVRIYFKR